MELILHASNPVIPIYPVHIPAIHFQMIDVRTIHGHATYTVGGHVRTGSSEVGAPIEIPGGEA